MAFSSFFPFLSSLLLSLLSTSPVLTTNLAGGGGAGGGAATGGCFINAIYSFGDSIADTGNLLRMGPSSFFNPIGYYPYGISLKRAPTGRCSDGYLMIDYLSMALNLSLINPYLAKNLSFDNGINFAVAGATALDEPFFVGNDVIMPYAASSIGAQLRWFDSHLGSICSTKKECRKKLKRTLFLVGEIGGNDYSFALYQKKSIEDVVSFVPQVIQHIVDAVKKVIDAGALHIIVPGNFPIGCLPSYLAIYEAKGSSKAFDKHNCIKELNTFSELHNRKLQEELHSLREAYPQTNILYSDYYGAYLNLLENASSLGFDESALFKSCCGGGDGQYNFDINTICGAPGTFACYDPSKYISWDGIHLTQQSYKLMAQFLMQKFIYPNSKSQEIWKC